MEIGIITDDLLKQELLAQGITNNVQLHWIEEPVIVSGVQYYIDLLFDNSEKRIKKLKELSADLIIVNATISTCENLPENFVRIAGWPTFLNRSLIEAATANSVLKKKTEEFFAGFNKSIEWTPDIAGFISPRIISMLINEAYYTLEDKVSGKNEIDTAMKLGTRYPFGPFEWSQKIGLKNVDDLLTILSENQKRYTPSILLKQEAKEI